MTRSMRNRLRVLGLCGVFVAGLLAAADAPRAKEPEDVARAQSTLKAWIQTLKDQTPAQVETLLGAPSDMATWEFESKNEPLHHYKLSSGGQLSLYFYKGQAINVSVQLLSD